MELHLHSHHLEHRSPDWVAAAASGFVAGAILMVLELIWSSLIQGANPWFTSHMIAGIVLGIDVVRSSGFSVGIVGVALIVHYVLGIAFGLVLAAVMAPFHVDSSIGKSVLVGAVFGLILYLVNFYVLAGLFPWFADMRGWAALSANLIFGMAAAVMYMTLERPEIAR
ncbi:hypothetical protein [Noviherbaspirillum denitrificans]|uniref:Sodium:proline symporter n=1 Tax=Noviherbaspirillum denitrificans TaxID=1968433 RepID=A0A254TH01_9BURK|nr:hypothetical protein [Noviherbaspirillum denitrificans]OWW20582.1 hypothetical protein AYR66_14890 [Noviherbaspirillum denitrificans]